MNELTNGFTIIVEKNNRSYHSLSDWGLAIGNNDYIGEPEQETTLISHSFQEVFTKPWLQPWEAFSWVSSHISDTTSSHHRYQTSCSRWRERPSSSSTCFTNHLTNNRTEHGNQKINQGRFRFLDVVDD